MLKSVSMDIQARKIEFVQEFLKIQNEELLTRLEKLLSSNTSVSGNELKQITVEELNKRIDKSMSDSENNKLTISSDFILEVEKWI